MQNRHQSRAIARKTEHLAARRLWLTGSAIFMGMTLLASHAFADSHVEIIESHAFNEYGSIKYPADFA